MIYAILGAVVAICSIVTFALYASDKKKATKNEWRIKESTLITAGFLMGGLGGLLGMKLLRHKTKHLSFKVLVPLSFLFNIIVIVAVLFFTGTAPF